MGMSSESDYQKAAYILNEEEFLVSEFFQQNDYR